MIPDSLSEPLDWTVWRRMKTRLSIAYRIFRTHPTMPATAFWRIFEAEIVLRALRGEGRGLDVGCGDGSFASMLFPIAPGLRWCGVDRDDLDAALARKNGPYEEVQHVCGEDMPYEDSSFDIVFSNCVLEHVEGLDAVLVHVGRVLKPGGRFMFTVPTESFYETLCIPRVLRLLRLSQRRQRYIDDLGRRLEIVNLLSSEGWSTKLQASGMSIQAEVPYATRRAAGWWEMIATLTGGVAYWVAGRSTTPRKIQQSANLASSGRSWLGTIFFALLLPILLLTVAQANSPPYAGRFVVAVKRAGESVAG